MASTTTASTTAPSQAWIYPPGGDDVPPLASTGNIGPVHFLDSMVLQWTPDTQPEITWTCFSEAGNQTGDVIIANQSQPLFYQFNQQANQANTSDPTYCHIWFSDMAQNGNTVTWQYFNNRSENGPVTFSAPAAVATSASASASGIISTAVTSSVATSATQVSANAGQSTSATSTPTAHSNGLSAGATTGIAVGVVLGVLLIAALVAFVVLSRRRKNRKAQAAQSGRHPAWMDDKPHSPPVESAPAYSFGRQGHGNTMYAKLAQSPGPAAPSELPSNDIAEMAGHGVASELAAQR